MRQGTASLSWRGKACARDGACKNAWESGTRCEYENCRCKNERPSEEPEEDPTPVQCNTVGLTADSTEITVQDLRTLRDSGSVLPINNTSHWLNRSKFWMQPEDDSILCTGCNAEHSAIKQCSGGGQHSMMPTEMRRDAEAIMCRWIPFSVQQAAEGKIALVTATRAVPLKTLVMATQEMRKQSLVPQSRGYYGELGYASESSQGSDCDYS